MTTISEIPLTPSQPQNFSIGLNGVSYNLSFGWRKKAAVWLLDIADTNGNVLIAGVPLLPGADILGQYPDLNLGGELWVGTDGSDDPPTFDNLGVASHLYFVVR